jgi:hypothetical protein
VSATLHHTEGVPSAPVAPSDGEFRVLPLSDEQINAAFKASGIPPTMGYWMHELRSFVRIALGYMAPPAAPTDVLAWLEGWKSTPMAACASSLRATASTTRTQDGGKSALRCSALLHSLAGQC